MIAIEFASPEALHHSRPYWEALIDTSIQHYVKAHDGVGEEDTIPVWLPHAHPRPSFTIMEEMKARYFLGGWAMRLNPDAVKDSFQGCIEVRRASAADAGDLLAA